jgi:hypothetical protein
MQTIDRYLSERKSKFAAKYQYRQVSWLDMSSGTACTIAEKHLSLQSDPQTVRERVLRGDESCASEQLLHLLTEQVGQNEWKKQH